MEKYTQYRDRGTGVAPFMPILTAVSVPSLIVHLGIFLFRLPFFVVLCLNYFLVLQFLPLPLLAHKLLRWSILIFSGIFFVDIQVDGVKRGALASQPKSRIPHPKSVIASNFTSPIDSLYLAAIFDPIFILSFPHTRKVQKIGLFTAIKHALNPVIIEPPNVKQLTTLSVLLRENPDRIIVVFPECTTTNGRGLLPLSPSLLSVPRNIDIFPLSIRYTLPDVTTPVPQSYMRFFWSLLSRPTTYIRVRLADAVHNTSQDSSAGEASTREASSSSDAEAVSYKEEPLSAGEKKILNQVSDALARLGRNKRVGLTLRDKAGFTKAWYAAGR